MERNLVRILISLLLVLLAAVSFFLISMLASNSGISQSLVASIDDKTNTVMKLTSASAVASAVISTFPGDMATPIAEELADLTGYFLIVLSVLYTEKALILLLGSAVFKVLIPAACAVGILGIWVWKRGRHLARNIVLFTLAIIIAIPASLLISDSIYKVYSYRIDETLDSSEELNEKAAPLAEADRDESIIAGILGKISETASSLSDKAADLLNRFVESTAIMFVTSCVLPCLGFVLILWLIKLVFGADVLSLWRHDRSGETGPCQGADDPGGKT